MTRFAGCCRKEGPSEGTDDIRKTEARIVDSVAEDESRELFAILTDEKFMRADKDTLIIGIAARVGTPAFIYDGPEIISACHRLADVLRKVGSLCYSIKANPNPAVCRLIREYGLGAEVASEGELTRALEAGFSPEQIVASGPGKSDRELAAYIERGLLAINVESEREIERIDRIANECGNVARVAIRVNPNFVAKGARIRMGGQPSQFGIDEERLAPVLAQTVRRKRLEFVGIHAYWGTQIMDARWILAAFEHVLGIAGNCARQLGRRLSLVNLGGGFGVPFSTHETALDLEELRSGISALANLIDADPLLCGTRFIFESGRFLVGPSGSHVSRVVDLKVSRNRTFVVLESGINAFFAASPLFRFERKNPRLRVISERSGVRDIIHDVDVVGPLCTSLDCLARGVSMERPKPGDLIVFENAGAYGLTMSLAFFLGRDIPVEITLMPSGELVQTRWSIGVNRGAELDVFQRQRT